MSSNSVSSGELVAGFRKYGPAISGLYNCVARMMILAAQGYEKTPMVPRELRHVCEALARKRAALINEGTISVSSWLPSYTHSQINWVQSIWEILTSDMIPEYVIVDAHLLFWVLWNRIEPLSRPDVTVLEHELLQWTRNAEKWNHHSVLSVLARLWPDSSVVISSPAPTHGGRENLQQGLFLDLFKMLLKRNLTFLETYAISSSGRPSSFQAISRPTSSAGLEAQIWGSPLMGMSSSEYSSYDTGMLSSDMDRLMQSGYGETSGSGLDFTVSPPPQDSYFPETYFPSDNIHGVRGNLSVSPPLFGQITPGLFEPPSGGYDDVYGHGSSPLHLAPMSGDERPQSALLRRRSDRSPGRRPRRLSRSDEEEGSAHGWDSERKMCMLELPEGGPCNTRVQTYNNFLRHCRFQHEGKEPREECTLCGQSFGRPDALRNHKEKSKKHKKLERLHASR
ncbi:hypothetical protein H072_7557 [Dactylellina haptotyla CBS 200.50]|uniref:C2H2-type domain-containing protein n=1 Tax=Dactylellina haptotyla (strain CBS 200.50) TaxID=1284197 RepID=S8A740_DACHA|nr:hypothetical protein H072_7557 [Dactylellina haptotyla CBS 200.50]